MTSAFLHRIFTLIMDNIGTLLGLFMCVLANVNQTLNYPFKRIYIIVVHDESYTGDIVHEFLNKNIFLCKNSAHA